MTRGVARVARRMREILLFTVLVLALLTPTLPGAATVPAHVSGTVTSADSPTGLENVWVSVWDQDAFYDEAFTGTSGNYQLNSLPSNGTYSIDFWKDGYAYYDTQFTYSGNPVIIDVELQALSVVATGTVTSSETGLPIEDAWLYVVSQANEDFWGYAYTDSEGHYTLYDEAEAGACSLDFYVEAEAYKPAESSATWNGTDVLNKDFVLDPALVVAQGTVTDAKTGQPIPDAFLWAGEEDGWDYVDIGYAGTNEDGKYTLYDLYDVGATSFTMYVDAYGYESVEVDLVWNGSVPLAKDFALRPLFPWTGNVEVVPIEGDNRYETAVQGSRMAFPDAGSCNTVVLASGENFPDALGGSALAGAFDCPVLLTKPGQLSSVTASEIKRLGAKTAWVVGGSAAVSDSVLTSLGNLGIKPQRIAGATRYETASLVAQKTVDVLGPKYSGDVMFATGENFPDALAAAPLAAYAGVPILLVRADSVPGTTLAALKAIDPGRGMVLGGDKVVGTSAYNTLKTKLGADSISRLAGKDRYATACIVAEFGVDEYGLSWGGAGFSTGTKFPDALAGGATQGLMSTVMLLTKTDSVPSAVSNTIDSYGDQINEVHFYGGTAAIGDSVRKQIVNHVKAMHLP